jgi:uncharacterized membrane protein YgcG
MAEQTKSEREHKHNMLAALVIILLLLLLLLGGLLAWAFMRLNGLEDDMNGTAKTNATQGVGSGTTSGNGSGTTGTGSGTTSGGTGSTTNGGSGTTSGGTGSQGKTGTSGTDSTTTLTCAAPAQRVTLPNGTEVCVTVDPIPALNL